MAPCVQDAFKLTGILRCEQGRFSGQVKIKKPRYPEPECGSVQVPNRTLVRGQLLTQHPDLMALRAEVRAAAERVNEARASRWPGVDLQVSQLRDRGLDRPARYETLLGASLAVPLLDPRKAAIDLAQSQVQRAELALKAREQSLLREFDSAWAALASWIP